MTRGRQSRRKVADRVRAARELEIFERYLPIIGPGPSARFERTGSYMTHGILSGMKEAQRRITLRQEALKRKRNTGLRLKSITKKRNNLEDARLNEIARQRRRFQDIRDRKQYGFYYDEEYDEDYVPLRGLLGSQK